MKSSQLLISWLIIFLTIRRNIDAAAVPPQYGADNLILDTDDLIELDVDSDSKCLAKLMKYLNSETSSNFELLRKLKKLENIQANYEPINLYEPNTLNTVNSAAAMAQTLYKPETKRRTFFIGKRAFNLK
jgi:hypothetical protein